MALERKKLKEFMMAYAYYHLLKVGAIVMLYLLWATVKDYFNISFR
jgi:hypothetical protein